MDREEEKTNAVSKDFGDGTLDGLLFLLGWVHPDLSSVGREGKKKKKKKVNNKKRWKDVRKKEG